MSSNENVIFFTSYYNFSWWKLWAPPIRPWVRLLCCNKNKRKQRQHMWCWVVANKPQQIYPELQYRSSSSCLIFLPYTSSNRHCNNYIPHIYTIVIFHRLSHRFPPNIIIRTYILIVYKQTPKVQGFELNHFDNCNSFTFLYTYIFKYSSS